jgi:hypothetical protein
MEQVVEEENLERALRAVERKRGAAGIDKMTTRRKPQRRGPRYGFLWWLGGASC